MRENFFFFFGWERISRLQKFRQIKFFTKYFYSIVIWRTNSKMGGKFWEFHTVWSCFPHLSAVIIILLSCHHVVPIFLRNYYYRKFLIRSRPRIEAFSKTRFLLSKFWAKISWNLIEARLLIENLRYALFLCHYMKKCVLPLFIKGMLLNKLVCVLSLLQGEQNLIMSLCTTL